MGYSTDFSGEFNLNKKLTPTMQEFLTKFSQTRRMGRKMDAKFGVEGEFFVDGTGMMGQNEDGTVIDGNTPPITQPGLWCGWEPSEDGESIKWNESEKFYDYNEWLVYLIEKILKPNGYVLNGEVTWQGDEIGDVGEIIVEDNVVSIKPFKGKKKVLTPDKVVKETNYVIGKGYESVKGYMQTDVVFLEEIKKPEPKKKAEKVKEVATSAPQGVVIVVNGLKANLDERQLATLLKVVKNYTATLVDKGDYTIIHNGINLK